MHKILLGAILLQPVVFSPLTYKMTVVPKIVWTSLLLIFLTSLIVIEKKDNDKIYITKNFLYIPLFLYFISFLVSTLFSMHKPESVYYFSQIITYFLFFFLFVNIIKEKKDIELFITIIIIGGVLVSFYAILQVLKIDIVPWGEEGLRFPISTIGFPSLLSAYLCVVFPFSLYRVIYSQYKAKILYFISLVLIISSIILSFGRAGMLSVAIITLLFLLVSRIRYVIAFIILFLLIFSGILYKTGKIELFKEEWKEKKKTVMVRLYLWEEIIKGIELKAPFGTGVNTFSEIYPKIRTTKIFPYWGYKILPNHAHNEFLQIAITQGLFGVFCYFFVIITFILKIKKFIFSDKLYQVILFSFFAYLFQSMFTPNIMDTNLLFFAILGFCGVATNERKYFEVKINLKPIYKNILFYIYCAVAIILIIYTLNLAVADYYFRKAKIYATLRIYDRSLFYFAKCVSFNKKDVLYQRDFAELYLKLSEENAWNKNLLEKAIKRYEIVVKLNPYNAAGYGELGEALKIYAMFYDGRKFKEAIKHFKHAQKIDKNFPMLYNGLGGVYFDMKDYNNAEKQFKKAIEIAPLYTDAYYHLAIVYIKKEKIKEAKEVLSKAQKIAPGDKKINDLLKTL